MIQNQTLILLATLDLLACGGQTEGPDDAGRRVMDSSVVSPDATVDSRTTVVDTPDAIADSQVATEILGDCEEFCMKVTTSFPECTDKILSSKGPSSCKAWCLDVPSAAFTSCSAKAVAYLRCINMPGNLTGCDDAGLSIPACAADNDAIDQCLRP
jgi:hypothetical protein